MSIAHPNYHLKFQSIDAVLSGDLGLLQQSLPHVDIQMAASLAIAAVENDHLHHLGCLLEKSLKKIIFKLRRGQSLEPLLYVGLTEAIKPHAELVDSVNRSRVLCLFKILHYKYIYLGVESIFDLVQILLHEEIYKFWNDFEIF